MANVPISKMQVPGSEDTLLLRDSTAANKVQSATNGNLAGLDANGNLTDSGVAANNVVKKSGDTMTGNLTLSNASGEIALRATGSRYTHIKSSATGADHTNYFPNKDGTLATTSDVDIVSNEIEAIVNVYGSKNLFNPDTFVYGIINYVNGNVDSSSWWITSDFIACSGSVVISGWKDGVEDNFCVRFAEYDANKGFIKNVNDISITSASYYSDTITLDPNTRYVRASFGFNNKVTTLSAFFATNRIMIQDARISDSTYVPYAMTNRELTEKFWNPIFSGVLSAPILSLNNEYGNNANKPLNIDQINMPSGYMIKLINNGYLSGDITGLFNIIGGNSALLFGFSAWRADEQYLYGGQIAIGIVNTAIAIRVRPYNAPWGSWKTIASTT